MKSLILFLLLSALIQQVFAKNNIPSILQIKPEQISMANFEASEEDNIIEEDENEVPYDYEKSYQKYLNEVTQKNPSFQSKKNMNGQPKQPKKSWPKESEGNNFNNLHLLRETPYSKIPRNW